MNLEIIDESISKKEEINTDSIKPSIEYASVSDRIKANLINILLLFGLSELADSTLILSSQTKKIIYICIFVYTSYFYDIFRRDNWTFTYRFNGKTRE